MASIQKQIRDLQQDINDLISGYYTQPTALGPNTLSKNSVKARTIRSGNIDVSNLEAVQTKTGSLTVDGNLTIGTGGSLRSGKTNYSDVSNAGFWMGIDSAVTKIRVGNIGHTAGWTWDGTTLAVAGTITATSGTIGGWTIASTDLTADGGATGIASSGSYRFWTGDATPANAEFSVTSLGALKSTSGTIGGWTINGLSGLYTGSGSSQRGIDTGSTTFYAGSSTPGSAPFRVSSSGVLTATGATIGGALTATSLSITGTASFSGGSMTLPNGGSITSSTVDLNQGTLSGLDIDGTLLVSGGAIKTGTSGARLELDNSNGIRGYDSGGTLQFQIKHTDGKGYFSGGNAALTTNGAEFVVTTLFDATRGISWRNSIGGGTVYAAIGAASIAGSGWLYINPDEEVLMQEYGGSTTYHRFGCYASNPGHYQSYGGMYPGNGGMQSTLSMKSDGSTIWVDNAGNKKFRVSSNGAVGFIASATYGIATGYTTLGSLTGRIAVHNDSGILVGYVPVYTDIT